MRSRVQIPSWAPELLAAAMLGETSTKMTMVYWKSDRFWLGKLLEHPEIDENLARHSKKYLGIEKK
jgi:hypothetical protein